MTIAGEWFKAVPRPRHLAGGDEWNVFLSYRSADRAWVMNLYDVLREAGHRVFLDQCVLSAGDELVTRLEEALDRSQAGVLVWSSASRDSDWVRREFQVMERQTTRKRSFRFVPLKLDNSEMPAFASNRAFLDFRAYPDGPNGGGLLRLLHAVVDVPLSTAAVRLAIEQDEASNTASARVRAAIRNGRAQQLLDLFGNGGLPWKTSATLGSKAAEGLIRLGEYTSALEVLRKLEHEFPRAVRPKQLRALALNRRARANGSQADLTAAQDVLGLLYERGERDPETLGIYGATWMERYKHSKCKRDLRYSRDLYLEAFKSAQDDYYTGINAAAKSVLLGSFEDLGTAATLAARVQEIVGTEPCQGDYWMTATAAEARLIRKAYEDAARLYAAAVDISPTETGSHSSTWEQACALMSVLQPEEPHRSAIQNVFAHLRTTQSRSNEASPQTNERCVGG